ncbi:DUF1990 family protein [Parafrigoribacterium soli]|uniref:DUF1990 family protein n=1 Tax=Parafrigoribacterium soli TaxID=3144663 RepID=UPI0032EAC50F
MAGSELWEQPVSYAAVGATQAADLLQYPPAGFRPVVKRVRIGHGPLRWSFASQAVLSWGVQRRSGLRVETLESPQEVTELSYTPLSLDTDGVPVPPTESEDEETVYGSDGTAIVAPGDTAWLHIPVGPFSVKAPARVVYVINDKKRKGFGYGTLAGHPESGEESFMVELGDDGSVWFEVRAFSRPSSPMWWIVYPGLRIAQSIYTRRYLRALSGPID